MIPEVSKDLRQTASIQQAYSKHPASIQQRLGKDTANDGNQGKAK